MLLLLELFFLGPGKEYLQIDDLVYVTIFDDTTLTPLLIPTLLVLIPVVDSK